MHGSFQIYAPHIQLGAFDVVTYVSLIRCYMLALDI
jgi:hypothetical protein